MITGCVIGESLRAGAVLELTGLRVCRVARTDLSGSAQGSQPPVWTVLEFESDAEDDAPLAQALADGLSPEGGWYADYRSGEERVVVFAGRIFATRGPTTLAALRRWRTGFRRECQSTSSTGRTRESLCEGVTRKGSSPTDSCGAS